MLIEDVKKSIATAGFNEGDKMPSVRKMAVQLGLSTATVHKAYRELSDEGFIKSYQGKGCFWGGLPVTMSVSRSDTNFVVETLFAKDLESGYLNAFERIPSIKELSIRYKVSPYSVKKFLNTQVARGVLRQVGAKYYFDEERPVGFFNYIIFVHRSDENGHFKIDAERESEVFRKMSQYAANQKIAVHFVGYHEASDTLFSADGHPFIPRDDAHCLGAFLSTWLVFNPSNLFAHFAKITSPISVWWEYAPDEVPKTTQNRKKWAFFNVAFGKEAGVIAAQHLKTKNLKKVHYVSPFHRSFWSKARLEGLENSGIEVLPLVNDYLASPFDVQPEAEKEGIDSQTFLMTMMGNLLANATLDSFVCSNDWVATTLLDYYKSKGLPRPYVLGFDDTIESYKYVFDSVAFNVETMVKEALYHITSPSIYANFRRQMQTPLGKVVEKK